MVSISIEMLIALPVIIGLALLVSMVMVNVVSGLGVPPVVNSHTEIVREQDVKIDLNGDGDLDDSCWIVTGSFTYRLSPNVDFEPRELVWGLFKNGAKTMLSEDEHVVLFAVCVSTNTSSLVITSPEGQVVVGLGASS